jgi:transmembrane sensor
MTNPTVSHRNDQIYREASEWLVEFRAGDADTPTRKSFHKWLTTSPEHIRAYLELAAIWNEGAALGGSTVFSEDALIQAVRAEANVVALGHDAKLSAPAQALQIRHGHLRWAIAASVGILAAGIVSWYERGIYATDLGEQRTITLEDGSHIELNAHSRVRVRFGSSERSVDLLEGEVFFKVAKDPRRPFIVRSETTAVRAVGTEFDVYQKSAQTTVTVIEGRVTVTPLRVADTSARPPVLPSAASEQDGTLAPFYLDAGEQAVVTQRVAKQNAAADVQAATAWTKGRLVFRGASLREVVEEFNRYNKRPIIIRDPELSEFKITGIFSSTDPTVLIRFLEARPDIAVAESSDAVIVSRKP